MKWVRKRIYMVYRNYKKKWIWVSWPEVDDPRACYTKGSKSEREYICYLEKWYWWGCLQGRNRDIDTENQRVDTAEEGEGGPKGWSSPDLYTLPCVKQKATGKLLHSTQSPAWCSWWDDLRGEMGAGKGGSRARGYMRALTADSCCCSETNTTL